MAAGIHKPTEQTGAVGTQPIDRPQLIRWLLAGFLAGATNLIVLLCILVVLLAIGGFWPLLYEISAGLRGELPFWKTLGDSAIPSLSNVPGFFWSARLGILAVGVLGLLLAAVDLAGSRIGRPWRHLTSLVALLGMVGTIVFALQYTNREQMLSVLAEQPGLATMRDSALVSDLSALIIGALIAVPCTYVIWIFWNWWYLRWAGWLGLEQRSEAPLVQQPSAPPDDWRSYQLRLHRTKRQASEERASETPALPDNRSLWVLLALMALMLTVLIAAVALYNSASSQLASADLWVSANTPEDQATVLFTRVPQRLTAAGISGGGLVDISFGSTQNGAPLRQAAGIRLGGLDANLPSTQVDLAGLEPGRYWVKAILRDGGGGQLRYTLLQGGGTLAQLASWLIGLAAGLALALALLVGLEALVLRGWGRPRSIRAG